MIWMVWTNDTLGALGLTGGIAGHKAGSGTGGHGWGTREAALPGEWRAFLVVLVAMAAVGAVILAATYLWHEGVVRRRRVGRVRAEARARTVGYGGGAVTGSLASGAGAAAGAGDGDGDGMSTKVGVGTGRGIGRGWGESEG